MDIVIVGAGPVGCYTAQLLKNDGIKARIIEEDRTIGRPIRCAGLVGRQVFEDILLPLNRNSIINRIDGATFFYENDYFQINREEVAYVIDRERFDKNLGEGLKVECGKKVIEIIEDKNGYILKTDSGENIFADFVIGADGANSRIRKYINFLNKVSVNNKKRKNIKKYLGVQYRIKVDKDKFCSKFTQVHLREGIPFFIWIIPESDCVIRVGLISENAREDLIDFIRERHIDGEIIERLAGLIPLGVTKIYHKNIALVGDSAIQVKPLTGGGIFYGLRSAEFLAESIIKGKFNEYDRRLKEQFGREIKFGLKARKLYEEINEKELKNIFDLFKKNIVVIEKVANFENHSVIFKEILKNPKIFGDVGKILSRNIGKLFL